MKNAASIIFKIKKNPPNKGSIEETYLNTIKAVYDKGTANITFISEKLKVCPQRSQMRHECSLSPVLFNIVLEVLATTINQEKEIKKASKSERKK